MNGTFFQWLTVADTACWIVCFWWMHRISRRQDFLLKELHKQGARIEDMSKAEHDLVKDMHPKVASIENEISEVGDAIKSKPRPDLS